MHNVLILGSGRSGTSMASGCLASAGYFMGHSLLPPRKTNPKGFFEDVEVNNINEAILAHVVPQRPNFLHKELQKLIFRKRPLNGQRWLARVTLSTCIPASTELKYRIQQLTSIKPFCFKDPRFSYTLPAWRPFLEDTVFVCVFREPSASVESILKESRQEKYLHTLSIDRKEVLDVWTLMYKHIIEKHSHTGKWLFMHFDQLLQNQGLDKLEAFTGAKVDRSFPDKKLKRTTVSEENTEQDALECYQMLCRFAEY